MNWFTVARIDRVGERCIKSQTVLQAESRSQLRSEILALTGWKPEETEVLLYDTDLSCYLYDLGRYFNRYR